MMRKEWVSCDLKEKGGRTLARFLDNCERHVGGVVSDKRMMTFFGGMGTSFSGVANGDTINKNFESLNIGPCCDWVCSWNAGLVRDLLYKVFDFVNNRVELGLSDDVMCSDYKIILFVISC